MATLRLELFGAGPVAREGGRPLRLSPLETALLGYLVLDGDRPHHRDNLAAGLWPDVDERSARNRLSSSLWRLRHTLEPDGATTGTYVQTPASHLVSFNFASDCWVDVVEFETAADVLLRATRDELSVPLVQRWTAVSSLYRPRVLVGCDHAWVTVAEQRHRRLYLAGAERVMSWYDRAGDVAAAVRWGRRILDHDPLREDVHRYLIGAYDRLGRRDRARAQFERCRRVLRDELDVAPQRETVAAAISAVREDPDDTRPAADVVAAATARRATMVAVRLSRLARDLGAAARELEGLAELVDGDGPSPAGLDVGEEALDGHGGGPDRRGP